MPGSQTDSLSLKGRICSTAHVLARHSECECPSHPASGCSWPCALPKNPESGDSILISSPIPLVAPASVGGGRVSTWTSAFERIGRNRARPTRKCFLALTVIARTRAIFCEVHQPRIMPVRLTRRRAHPGPTRGHRHLVHMVTHQTMGTYAGLRLAKTPYRDPGVGGIVVVTGRCPRATFAPSSDCVQYKSTTIPGVLATSSCPCKRANPLH